MIACTQAISRETSSEVIATSFSAAGITSSFSPDICADTNR